MLMSVVNQIYIYECAIRRSALSIETMQWTGGYNAPYIPSDIKCFSYLIISLCRNTGKNLERPCLNKNQYNYIYVGCTPWCMPYKLFFSSSHQMA